MPFNALVILLRLLLKKERKKQKKEEEEEEEEGEREKKHDIHDAMNTRESEDNSYVTVLKTKQSRDPWVAQRFGACLWPRA